jgi:hypothetical protein
MSKTDGTAPDSSTPESRKSVPFAHTWTDPWTEEEVSVSYRFARPTPAQIKRMQATASKNPTAAARNLILDVIHADDREAFMRESESYPGLVTTMGGALIKAVGLADLGN